MVDQKYTIRVGATNEVGPGVDAAGQRLAKLKQMAVSGSDSATKSLGAVKGAVTGLVGQIPGLDMLIGQFTAFGLAGAAVGVGVMALGSALRRQAEAAKQFAAAVREMNESLQSFAETLRAPVPTTEVGSRFERLLAEERRGLKRLEEEREKQREATARAYGPTAFQDIRGDVPLRLDDRPRKDADPKLARWDSEIEAAKARLRRLEKIQAEERHRAAAQIRQKQQDALDLARAEAIFDEAARRREVLRIRHAAERREWMEKERGAPGTGGDWALVEARQRQERILAEGPSAEARRAAAEQLRLLLHGPGVAPPSPAAPSGRGAPLLESRFLTGPPGRDLAAIGQRQSRLLEQLVDLFGQVRDVEREILRRAEAAGSQPAGSPLVAVEIQP